MKFYISNWVCSCFIVWCRILHMHDVFVTSFAMYLIKVYKVRDFLPIFGNMTPGFTFEQRQVNIFISCMGEGPKNDLCVKIMEFDACVLEVPFVLVFNFFSPTLVFFAILEMWIALSTHCCMTLHRKHYSIMFFIFF